MDSKKLKAILSTLAGIILILILLYNSGLFGRNDNPDTANSAGTHIGTEESVQQADSAGNQQSDNPAVSNESNLPTESAEPTEQVQSAESGQPAESAEPGATVEPAGPTQEPEEPVEYRFRSKKLLNDHYEKHGIEMGFDSAEAYEKAASDVINNPDALYKTEAEDGDHVYYIEETNEFVILSQDNYIRTYFLPSGGRSYFDRQ